MKKNMIMRYFVAVAVTASILLTAGGVFAQSLGTTRRVVSPYWQTDGGTYTFIGVTHPSLTGMASQIGIVVSAVTTAGSTSDAGTVEFTVAAGTTTKLFIVATNSGVNSTTVPSAKFIVTTGTSGTVTSSGISGNVSIRAKAQEPAILSQVTNADTNGQGTRYAHNLGYWGAIVVAASSNGFAMEFIGDLATSSTNPAAEGN